MVAMTRLGIRWRSSSALLAIATVVGQVVQAPAASGTATRPPIDIVQSPRAGLVDHLLAAGRRVFEPGADGRSCSAS